jgi:hypothetical protein
MFYTDLVYEIFRINDLEIIKFRYFFFDKSTIPTNLDTEA